MSALSGCGARGGGAGKAGERNYDLIYKEEAITVDADLTDLYSLVCKNDRLFASGTKYSEDYSTSSYRIVSFNEDGSDVQELDIPLETNDNYSNYIQYTIPDKEGNIYTLLDSYFVSDDGNVSEDTYVIYKYDASGKELWNSQVSKTSSSNDYIYYNSMVVHDEYGIFLQGSNGITNIDKNDGSIKGTIKTDTDIGSVFIGKDNKIYATVSDDNKGNLCEVDANTGKLTNFVKLPVSLYNYSTPKESAEHDMLFTDSNGVSTYDIGDNEIIDRCSYIDSDINPDDVYTACQLSNGDFVVYLSSYDDNTGVNNFRVSRLVKVDPKEAAKQKVITLGCHYLNYTVQKQILEFNKLGGEYRISVKDYSKYDTEDDYQAGLKKLNTDIISGNAPDIILADSDMPLNSYISKGVLECLDPYIEKDEEIDTADYLSNVVESFKTNGKSYFVVPSFQIYTVAARESLLEGKDSWDFDDVIAIAQKNNIDLGNVFGVTNRESFLYMAIYLDSYSFINWDEHKCSFNDGEFAKLLEFCKKLPKTTPDEVWDEDTDSWYRSGKALAKPLYLYGFSEYVQERNGYFGKDFKLIGFPGAKGNGSCLVPSLQFAINASSKDKDGAWQFIKRFLSKEYQDNIEYDFPVLTSSIEENADVSMMDLNDQDGGDVHILNKMQEYNSSIYLGNEEIKIDPLTQEERDEMMDFVKSVDEHISYNSEIADIIIEESTPFFEGQKSVQEVCDIIQSRVSVYVNENS